MAFSHLPITTAHERRTKSLMKSGIVSKVKDAAKKVSEALLISEEG
jgi:hypothetical protein